MTEEDVFEVSGGRKALNGTVVVPGDKSISHRAIMLAAIAHGTSEIVGLSAGEDVSATLSAVEAMGATISHSVDGAISIAGGDLHEPLMPINLGNSGTGLRLLCGLWSGREGLAVFFGDDSLSRRPLDRVMGPLREMGASITARSNNYAPVAITGGPLRGLETTLTVPSAQVKSAILLAGLSATTPTSLREMTPTRSHTEELLAQFGAVIEVQDDEIKLQPSSLEPTRVRVPGDPSQAAFWICAAAALPDSDVVVSDLYLEPHRTGFLRVLRRMGADVQIERSSGTLAVRGRKLRAATVEAHEVPSLIDELPALGIAFALAEGTSRVFGAGELRVKESDRIDTITAMLAAFGCRVSSTTDGYEVTGAGILTGARVPSRDDHRIAMSAAILARVATGESHIEGWSSVATSYPGFDSALAELLA